MVMYSFWKSRPTDAQDLPLSLHSMINSAGSLEIVLDSNSGMTYWKTSTFHTELFLWTSICFKTVSLC